MLATLGAAALLAACATSPGGRGQLVAPTGLHGAAATYSEVDLNLKLVLLSDVDECRGSECLSREAFDDRVQTVGKSLAAAAYRLHPDLSERIPAFDIRVIDKAESGFASSASGTILVFRGTAGLGLTESELEFALARELGHVIGRHHEENVTTSVVVSLLAQVLMPVLNIAGGAAALVSAGTLQNTALATAASYAGSAALKASFRPAQVAESDEIALGLLAESHRDCRELADSLEILAMRRELKATDWEGELRETIGRVASLMQGPPEPLPQLAAGDEREWRPGMLLTASFALPEPQLRWASSPF